jgi:hypothetical protein
MRSKATTIKDDINELKPDRATIIRNVRTVIRKHLPLASHRPKKRFHTLPLSRYPDTDNRKHLMLAALASQKTTVRSICPAPIRTAIKALI